tara:strand:- start:2420 stop:2773 length:354 start_codon:yes stop_codon:yes gene_type:complete
MNKAYNEDFGGVKQHKKQTDTSSTFSTHKKDNAIKVVWIIVIVVLGILLIFLLYKIILYFKENSGDFSLNKFYPFNKSEGKSSTVTESDAYSPEQMMGGGNVVKASPNTPFRSYELI